ncbi:MAG: hypothetical protein JXR25_02410 [Pontiellaceae bacterium]|nr:hypothetical protein [Pontiellaceae bacterium]MBN2783654.1 hypothetical protein [Pontiellaceae bacterium]
MDNTNLPDGLKQRFDRIDERLEDIHAHAVKTNGRVTKLEKTSLVLVTSFVVTVATRPDGLLTIIKMISTWVK